MLNFVGFRIFSNSICKKALINFGCLWVYGKMLQSRQICGRSFRRNYKKLDNDGSNENKCRKKAVQDPKISVIKPNREEIIMTEKDAQAHAKRLNMKLVLDESSRGDRKKYKLVKVTELFNDKANTTDTRRVYFRQEIDIHDLNVKLRQYLKMVLNGSRVVCIVDGKDKNKLGNILKLIEESEINNYLTSKTNTSTGMNIIFQITKKNTVNNES